ncbi:hypothetical protein AGMMS49960_16360 [Betaproteobacteria bacterium]|nr:hypothetical protein AGMMS49960_16360 [Betaproteobacteria bacterium]
MVPVGVLAAVTVAHTVAMAAMAIPVTVAVAVAAVISITATILLSPTTSTVIMVVLWEQEAQPVSQVLVAVLTTALLETTRMAALAVAQALR